MNVASGVGDADLGSYQRAARTLLVYGLITPGHPNPETLGLVRRFADALERDLAALAGYRLEVRPHVVRLLRTFDAVDPAQGARCGDARFDRVHYALLALALASLERAGVQITLSELADQVRALASTIPGLEFDPDRLASRRAFCRAVRWLEERAVVVLTDGSTDAWETGSGGEALYDIDREVARLLFQPSHALHGLGSIQKLLGASREGLGRSIERADRRQRLIRLLIERPVVYYADLDDALAGYARKEARSVGEELARLTGATLERRKEGLALIGDGRGFSDEPFPRPGGAAQAALLLIDAIATRVQGKPPVELIPWPDDGADALEATLDSALPDLARGDHLPAEPRSTPTASAPLLTDGWLRQASVELCQRHRDGLNAAYREDPGAFLADAVDVLTRADLLRRVAGGVVVLPALARYRSVRIRTATPRGLPLFAAQETR